MDFLLLCSNFGNVFPNRMSVKADPRGLGVNPRPLCYTRIARKCVWRWSCSIWDSGRGPKTRFDFFVRTFEVPFVNFFPILENCSGGQAILFCLLCWWFDFEFVFEG